MGFNDVCLIISLNTQTEQWLRIALARWFVEGSGLLIRYLIYEKNLNYHNNTIFSTVTQYNRHNITTHSQSYFLCHIRTNCQDIDLVYSTGSMTNFCVFFLRQVKYVFINIEDCLSLSLLSSKNSQELCLETREEETR